MQRIFEQHVGGRDLVDGAKVDGLAPKFREPTADNRLVILFLAHCKRSWIDLENDHRCRSVICAPKYGRSLRSKLRFLSLNRTRLQRGGPPLAPLPQFRASIRAQCARFS